MTNLNKVLTGLFVFFSCFGFDGFAQDGIGIGTESVNTDAILEIDSSTDGLLIPRMTTTQRIGIGASSNGLVVYDTDEQAFFYYNGSEWLRMVAQPAQTDLDMSNQKITNLTDGSAAKDVVNKGQLDTKLNLSGGTMTGNLNMGSSAVTNLASGSSASDAVNKGQLDTKLDLSGGTITGSIAMSNKKITTLANGTSHSDAINLGQLNDLEDDIGRLHQGDCHIGDIAGETRVTCSFGKNIGTSDYVVLGSLRLNTSDASGSWGNNDVSWVIINETQTSFQIDLEEDHSDTQNLIFRYLIFKM